MIKFTNDYEGTNVKQSLVNSLDYYTQALIELKKVKRLRKKDGKDFAKLEKNFENLVFKEYSINVYFYADGSGYTDYRIYIEDLHNKNANDLENEVKLAIEAVENKIKEVEEDLKEFEEIWNEFNNKRNELIDLYNSLDSNFRSALANGAKFY